MAIRWKIFIRQATFWLLAELTLTLLGMDDLADYDEYQGTLHPGYGSSPPQFILQSAQPVEYPLGGVGFVACAPIHSVVNAF